MKRINAQMLADKIAFDLKRSLYDALSRNLIKTAPKVVKPDSPDYLFYSQPCASCSGKVEMDYGRNLVTTRGARARLIFGETAFIYCLSCLSRHRLATESLKIANDNKKLIRQLQRTICQKSKQQAI